MNRGGGILRRNHGGGIMEELSGRLLGGIWGASGRNLEASGRNLKAWGALEGL